MRARKKSDLSTQLFYWLHHHKECAQNSLFRLLKNPLASLITIAMIAIAFIIPVVIYLLFISADNVVTQSQANKQITLFLLSDTSFEAAGKLSERLEKRADLYNIQLTSKTDALESFKQQSELGSVIDNLSSNPLPHIITANINDQYDDVDSLHALKNELETIGQIDQVELDLLWIQKLESILALFFKVLWITCVLLSTAVALIITNVIRWEVSSRSSELEIMRLLGGTDSYVRRPFLYSGLWLGFIGAAFAIVVLQICTLILKSSFLHIQDLFAGTFQIASLNFAQTILLLVLGSVFGLAGAWIAATRHLKANT